MPTRVPDPARERLWRKRLARWKVSGLPVTPVRQIDDLLPDRWVEAARRTG
jgi:hypothetical protein